MITTPLLLLLAFLTWQATRQPEGWAEGATRPAALIVVGLIAVLLAGRDAMVMTVAGALLGKATQCAGWRRGVLGTIVVALGVGTLVGRVALWISHGLFPL